MDGQAVLGLVADVGDGVVIVSVVHKVDEFKGVVFLVQENDEEIVGIDGFVDDAVALDQGSDAARLSALQSAKAIQFRESPVGCAYRPEGVSAEEAVFLQRMAWETVRAWPKRQ